MVERRYTVRAIFIGFILCLVAASPVVLLAQEAAEEAVEEVVEKAVEETAEEAPTFEVTMQSAQDSLGTARNDSMVVAKMSL